MWQVLWWENGDADRMLTGVLLSALGHIWNLARWTGWAPVANTNSRMKIVFYAAGLVLWVVENGAVVVTSTVHRAVLKAHRVCGYCGTNPTDWKCRQSLPSQEIEGIWTGAAAAPSTPEPIDMQQCHVSCDGTGLKWFFFLILDPILFPLNI